MTTLPAPPAPIPAPSWPACGNGATGADPVGCRGRRIDPHPRCLAHLAPPDRAAYLAGLTPGAEVDHCGTVFDEPLLVALLNAVRDPADGRPHFGTARFDGATFTGDAKFADAIFMSHALFTGATFTGTARFDRASFKETGEFRDATFTGRAQFFDAEFTDVAVFIDATFSMEAGFRVATFTSNACFFDTNFAAKAEFSSATFHTYAGFDRATFASTAWFVGATFVNDAGFDGATFADSASFADATFSGSTAFQHAQFASSAGFEHATFTRTSHLGPLVCASTLFLSGAVFGAPVTIETSAAAMACVRTRWEATTTLRLRYATLDLTDAVVTEPLAVTARTDRFPGTDHSEPTHLSGNPRVRVVSLRGVDASFVVLTDTDVSACLFADVFHLDQLRIRGSRTRFASPPQGWRPHRKRPWRWTRRKTLLEEHHWRAITYPPRRPTVPARRWTTGPNHPDPALTPAPGDLAVLYRDLRKAFEDGKNEPDAADFYYGEMEMRRHDRNRPRAERALLTTYWALSGYGLRSSRALAWLGLAMAATILAMMMWGLPTHEPKPQTSGTLSSGQRIDLTTSNPDPELHGSYASRFTTPRAEKASRIVVNSVIFRSSGQNLTTIGTYTEMASRFTEPILLALAALAVRGRVKR